MPPLTDVLRRPLALADLCPTGSGVILALRRHVVAARRGGDAAAQDLAARFACPARAVHMLYLVEQVAQVWPEPFTLSPPCCGRLTPDEWLLGRLAGFVHGHARAAFDAEAGDFLNAEARDPLWRALDRLVAALPSSG